MLNDDEFRKLLDYLDRPWSGYRKVRKGVKKRIRRHMEQLDCRTLEAYRQLIEAHPKEKLHCEQCLLVTISRFFRDTELWRILEERLLPQLINDVEPPIRIWSAGCAGGEEPYSLAILWDSIGGPPTLELLATDINASCLDRAQEGVFGRGSLKELPDHLRSAYFRPLKGDHQFSILKEKLASIQWHTHNLLHSPPPGHFHMVFLRNNLLTYHQGYQLQVAFDRILSVLTSGGYLVVGSHETLPASPIKLDRASDCPWVYRIAK
jgi:chemotaxis protein methyltransferase CheR